ncbi:flavoprotein, partial [Pedobacter sp. HMWF019]|uniref:NADPH-dependent FMN reductase n=1 Tax=Pedobacter sp. HMWF019 TaxID=2056856 RepID=UPI000D3C1E64
MNNKKNIVAICGSTRKNSSNLNLIRFIAQQYAEIFNFIIFEGLADLPHFNPELDNESGPKTVNDFRSLIKAADAVLICTPEYAVGVPGSLKNAIDWTVSSMEFSRKPVLLITASTSGHYAHQSLLGTLLIIESRITEESQFVISSIGTKINVQAQVTDQLALDKI